jgi:hypothetical protein
MELRCDNLSSCLSITPRSRSQTKGDAFGCVMVLNINGNRLLKVINTVLNEGILRVRSYYDFDYDTAS